jgi:hypothetical protein
MHAPTFLFLQAKVQYQILTAPRARRRDIGAVRGFVWKPSNL